MVTLAVTHETCYRYGARVELAQHVAHLRPRTMPGQQVLQVQVRVDPTPQHWTQGVDAFGNVRDAFALYMPHEALRVVATSRVERHRPPRLEGLAAGGGLPWEDVARRCAYRARAAFEPASEFTFASPFVPRLDALRAYAAPSLAAGRRLADAAADLMQRIHADFVYDGHATEVHTPLAQVLDERRGVCQDFAHLMIGALRAFGLPARYVSGYLLTQPAAGEARWIGADASHAWVGVWCPPLGWIDFDPTNAVLPGDGCAHVTLAYGRDYGDVTPLRGVIRGGGPHALNVAVTVTTEAQGS